MDQHKTISPDVTYEHHIDSSTFKKSDQNNGYPLSGYACRIGDWNYSLFYA